MHLLKYVIFSVTVVSVCLTVCTGFSAAGAAAAVAATGGLFSVGLFSVAQPLKDLEWLFKDNSSFQLFNWHYLQTQLLKL